MHIYTYMFRRVYIYSSAHNANAAVVTLCDMLPKSIEGRGGNLNPNSARAAAIPKAKLQSRAAQGWDVEAHSERGHQLTRAHRASAACTI